MRRPSKQELKNGVAYTLMNFATPIVFYFTFRLYGAKAAIGFAIGVTLVQLFFHWLRRMKPSPFFLLASGFTVVFGGVDLFLATPQFFRLEPFVQNFVLGTVFLLTVFTQVPILTYFAKALPRKLQPDISSLGAQAYLRKLTLIWAIYFYLKSFLFLYWAFHMDLGDLIIFRSLVGGVSLAVMFFGEVLYRRWFRRSL